MARRAIEHSRQAAVNAVTAASGSPCSDPELCGTKLNMERVHRVAALAPIFISLICFGLVLVGSSKYCAPPRADEGTLAHIFQVLMLAQVPTVFFYIVSRGRSSLLQIAPTVALQLFAWGLAAAAANVMT